MVSVSETEAIKVETLGANTANQLHRYKHEMAAPAKQDSNREGYRGQGGWGFTDTK